MVLELAVSVELAAEEFVVLEPIVSGLAAAGLVFVGLAGVSQAGGYSALIEVVPDTYKAVLELVSRPGQMDG